MKMTWYFRPWIQKFSSLPLKQEILSRPPIVTIMGHVDHGKTTMLDYLRKTSVAASEAGGITQHIGAFQVSLASKTDVTNRKLITFIDTPGHAAFSKMRQRGAIVTDLIVLVVAVEDGVMPQTEEVIQLSKTTNTPLIVAMNKWDKVASLGGPESSAVRKLKDSLARFGVELEEFGGSVQCIPVSAFSGLNMDVLQEAIISEAEMMELTADPCAPLEATIIESRVLPGLGPVATAIVHSGTLKQGMFVATDKSFCRVRSLRDHSGKPLTAAGPSVPVEIVGWKNSRHPATGSKLVEFKDESECKKFLLDVERLESIEASKLAVQDVRKREVLDKQLLKIRRERSKDLSMKPIHVLDYDSVSKSSARKRLEIVLHTDVIGSQEALIQAIKKLPQNKVEVEIVAAEIGTPSESSIDLLATCNNPSLVGFNVSISKATEKVAKEKNIKIVCNNIIYHLLDELQEKMADLLPPLETETTLGSAKVLQLFPASKELVLGCRVDDGILTRQVPPNSTSRSDMRHPEIIFSLERNGKEIWRGSVKSLKHLKKDISQAQKGLECGIILEGLDDSIAQPNDILKCVKKTFSRPSIK